MPGKPVKFENWIYKKDVKATLIANSKPNLHEGRYWVEAIFLPDEKKLERPFSDLTLLIKNGVYKDGVYQPKEKEETVELELQFTEDTKPKPFCKTSKHGDEYERYTFGFDIDGEYYVLPLEVLIRDVLAPDAEILNMLTSLDLREIKFLLWMEDDRFFITLMSDLPRKYGEDDDKIRHLAWLFSNPGIELMLSQTYLNINEGKGICFDWGFDSLKIVAVVECNKGKRFIQRITHVRKQIKATEIVVHDKRNIAHENGVGELINRNRTVPKNGEELVTNTSGSCVDLTDWVPNAVEVEYESLPIISRVKHDSNKAKTTTSYTDKTSVLGDGRRTTGEVGGGESIPRLIFKQRSTSAYMGEFSDISDILNELKQYEDVVEIQSSLLTLKLHCEIGAFCYLADGKTERCYFAGKIIFNNKKEAVILDVQRENLKISRLIIISSATCNWDDIIHIIMKNTVIGSGKWPKETISNLCNELPLRMERCNHTHSDSKTKANTIYEKMKNISKF